MSLHLFLAAVRVTLCWRMTVQCFLLLHGDHVYMLSSLVSCGYFVGKPLKLAVERIEGQAARTESMCWGFGPKMATANFGSGII